MLKDVPGGGGTSPAEEESIGDGLPSWDSDTPLTIPSSLFARVSKLEVSGTPTVPLCDSCRARATRCCTLSRVLSASLDLLDAVGANVRHRLCTDTLV